MLKTGEDGSKHTNGASGKEEKRHNIQGCKTTWLTPLPVQNALTSMSEHCLEDYRVWDNPSVEEQK